MTECSRCESDAGEVAVANEAGDGVVHVALLGNPNTGKTTLFNRLCGLRHKTSNFAGTTQEARVGVVIPARDTPREAAPLRVIDLPGVYSLELQTSESEICRQVLAGRLSPKGEVVADPDVVLVVADAANLPRNLCLIGEVMRRRLPMVVALNMMDLARKQGLVISARALGEQLSCTVVPCSARDGEGLDAVREALSSATVATRTPPGDQTELEHWAERVYAASASRASTVPDTSARSLTDRLDALALHPVTGLFVFTAVMAGLFYVIFSIAAYPMDVIESLFTIINEWIRSFMPGGILTDLITDGMLSGVGATVVFLPQICLLFFLISLLEDTGYLARAALLMDRVLRPFGLPGHAFVPLLSSHACALPGITACRVIPDRRERLAAILVAPFMTCSARLPVYVLVTTLLFADRPALAGLAFVGCYALGAVAGLFSALLVRRTLLKGGTRAMAIELPTYKLPSIRTALLTTLDRGVVFLRSAGTIILCISIALWWLSTYPKSEPPEAPPPAEAVELRQKIVDRIHSWTNRDPATPEQVYEEIKPWQAQAEAIEAEHEARAALEAKKYQAAHSFAGRIGRFVQPVFEPLGYDWRLTVGVMTSFAAREVFVSTMAVVTTGQSEEDEGVFEQIQTATRDDGTPIFTTATSWSVLVYFVLAMQCLPTLAVTAREAGGGKWALLQFTWMSVVAYVAALIVYQSLRAFGYA